MITDNKLAILIARKLNKNRQVLLVVPSVVAARRMASDISFFSDERIMILPEHENESFRYEAKSHSADAMRLSCYSALANGEGLLVIAPQSALEAELPPLNIFVKDRIVLEPGLSIDRDILIKQLVKMGYERMGVCEAFGEFAVRGDIIDVFGPLMDNPVRIELFDDEIDSLRSYDVFSQRSIENLDRIVIDLVRIEDKYAHPAKLNDYLKDDALVINNDNDLFEDASENENNLNQIIKPCPVYAGHMNLFEDDLKKYAAKNYEVYIVASSDERVNNLKDYVERLNLHNVKLLEGSLSCGVELPEEKIIYISENDIFANYKRLRKKSKSSAPIKAFTDIKAGDYVVHEMHGIGLFTGVVKLTVDGATKDYLKIQYAGKDVLYIPVDQMDNIQKYVGSEGVAPRVSKLSGGEWQAIKQRAKESIRDMAEEFLKAAAIRETAPGFAFGPDTTWQKEFEDAFPYTETDDQLRAIEEIKYDMQKPVSMDRLLCGDVGYGKTEVAARAIFKALEEGKQVAVLVPTTILANQHYHTFLDRFKNYPFAIEMLSRFRDEKAQNEIVRKIEKGDIDLIVGTHRLLSKDVKFKDLGLLVIDEEQRFGVEHKEKIKQYKDGVDVLTLSATPIPRTLHMSLIGIRNMSVIEQPPEDRYPVQTYVMEQEDEALKNAILRELARGGQVYFVYNRVRGIQSIAKHISELVPEARIGIGHGQMGERELEDVMYDFTTGKTDILVATTIIESGLDIPNVNTLIVLDADHFGLSQLYQLRGRVGRSSRMAYAYLFVKKDKQLTEVAEKRLRAIKEFTEFGSGFRVAMRDLELRGAGNILGVEQSGHMLNIGYELYCKLVDEAVAELKGEAPSERPIESDTAVEIGLSAFLPESYVSDELVRLDLYKRIASIYTDEDENEMLDELLDRFGDLPAEAGNLLSLAHIRNIASRCGIKKIVKQQNKIVLLFDDRNVLEPAVFANLMDVYGPALTIYGGLESRISLTLKPDQNVRDEAMNFVLNLKKKAE